MANQEMEEKILNKQFKKTAFAGYETIDVDSFFDQVIDYLKANDKSLEVYKQEIDKLRAELAKAKTENSKLYQELAQQTALVKQFEAEGYGNVITNKQLNELKKQVKDLRENGNGRRN